jgi:hypothetical protein
VPLPRIDGRACLCARFVICFILLYRILIDRLSLARGDLLSVLPPAAVAKECLIFIDHICSFNFRLGIGTLWEGYFPECYFAPSRAAGEGMKENAEL